MKGKLKVNKSELDKLKVASQISGVKLDGDPIITGNDMRFNVDFKSAQELFDFAILSKEVSGSEKFGEETPKKKSA